MTRENKQFLKAEARNFFYQMWFGAGNLLLAGLILIVISIFGCAVLFDNSDVSALIALIFGN